MTIREGESDRIEMSRRERDRLKVLDGVIRGERPQKEAARLLRLTARDGWCGVHRLVVGIRLSGVALRLRSLRNLTTIRGSFLGVGNGLQRQAEIAQFRSARGDGPRSRPDAMLAGCQLAARAKTNRLARFLDGRRHQGRSAVDFLSQLLRGPRSEDCTISDLNVWRADAAVALKSPAGQRC
jgi:hypothetical protein